MSFQNGKFPMLYVCCTTHGDPTWNNPINIVFLSPSDESGETESPLSCVSWHITHTLTFRQFNPFLVHSQFIVVSRGHRVQWGKITFFQCIHYLTVSRDEYCALSALCKEGIESPVIVEQWFICLLSWSVNDSLSRSVSVRLYHF